MSAKTLTMPYIKGRKAWFAVRESRQAQPALAWIALCPYDRFTTERDEWMNGYWDKVYEQAGEAWGEQA
jgi:hypothetical protein